MNLFLELLAVILGLVYLFFLIKENKLCWVFGIASSLVSIFLFYKTRLYAESILYIYYVIIGVYGYYLWDKKQDEDLLAVTDIKPYFHLLIIVSGIILSYMLGYVFSHYTNAQNPYLDATTTIFSFMASYLEAKKKLSGWLYWIIINLTTVFLYFNRSLDYYAALTVIYTVFSFIGYFKWRQRLQTQWNAL